MPDESTPQQPPPPLPPRRRVYTIPRLADELGISERTIRRMIAARKIGTVPISDQRIGVPASEFERIVAGNLHEVAEAAR